MSRGRSGLLLSLLVARALGAQDADLGIKKTVFPVSAAVGETTTFTLIVTNEGPESALAVLVDDPLPPGLGLIIASPECSLSGDRVLCSIPELPSGFSANFTLAATPIPTLAPPHLLFLSGRTQEDEPGVFARPLGSGDESTLAVGSVLRSPYNPTWPVTPRGVAREPGGTLVICDAGDPRIWVGGDVNGDGRILRLDPATGEVIPVFEYDLVANPSGIVVADNGIIYFADEHTPRRDENGFPTADLTGAIRSIAPGASYFEIVSELGLLVRPLGIDLDPVDGTLMVADGSGLVLRIDPLTGGQIPISAGGLLGEPRALAFDGPGSLLVVDGVSGIVRVEVATGAQIPVTPLGGPAALADPWDLVLIDGILYVTDAAGAGALVALDPATGAFLERTTSSTWGPLWGIEGSQAFLNTATVSHAGTDPNPANDVSSAVIEHGGGYVAPVVLAISESVGVSDTVALLPSILLTIAETVAVADGVSVSPAVLLMVTETLAVSDQPALRPSVLVTISEAVVVSDGFSVSPAVLLAITETVAVSDQLNLLPSLLLELSESIAVTDTVTFLPSILVAIAETVQVSDMVTPAIAVLLLVDETIAVGDTLDTARRSDAPPRILRILTAGRGNDGVLEFGETTDAALTRFLAVFDEDVYDPPGDVEGTDVSNPANWHVLGAGPDGDFQTADCAGGIQGDDIEVQLAGITYLGDLAIASLAPAGDMALAAGDYRLMGCGTTTITDLGGDALDGDGNGIGGDDFVLPFRVALTHLAHNPNLDENIDGWTLVAPPGTVIQHAPEDVGGIPTSGSAFVDNLGQASDLALFQCLPVTPESQYRAAVALRQDSSSLDTPEGWLTLEWMPSPDCQGTSIGDVLRFGAAGHTEGGWVVPEFLARAPEGSSAALLTLLAVTPEEAVEIRWDEVRFAEDPYALFGDGFESGDASAWSTSPP